MRDILADQVITVKRGRMNNLGFEPLFNSYYDYYLDSRYFGKPLLQLEDVTFHLYLRKNLNDSNPRWKMPSYRQMKAKFGIGQDKIQAILKRLTEAHLLTIESGVGKGIDGKNTNNNYILSDPISTLEEFLTIASEGLFGVPVLDTYQIDHVPDLGTSSVPDLGKHEQTLIKQTWEAILNDLKVSLLPSTFNTFLADTELEIVGATAIIKTSNLMAHSWIESRLKERLLKQLKTVFDIIDLRCQSHHT